jgi:hypothetical protein|tara:strand:- start:3174 stop:5321 length:2148 start_codon:yes stop_codon:yes gene_type:complete
MALMDKPLPEDVTDTDIAVPLTEDGDVEEENINYSGAVAFVNGQYTRSKDARYKDEERWLDAYRNYRGIYSSEVQFTDTEKSKAFIKVTKTKVLAAYAQVVDVLFAGSKFPIGIEARQFPNNLSESVSYNPNALTDENVKEKANVDYKVPTSVARPDIAKELGLFKDTLQPVKDDLEQGSNTNPGAITFEPAKRAAQKMEKLMHDQLDETDAPKHLRSVAFETTLFGTGIFKGPFALDKEYPRWDEEGNYDPLFETIPKMEYVSIWDFYPDPDARNMTEAEFTVQRHRLNRTQMRTLKKRPHFRIESIELAIDYGADYQREYWEDALEDDSVASTMERYEVLEYWGILDAELAEEADIKIPKELADQDEVQVNIWICNGQILRLVLNPFTPTRIPYLAVPYELNPYSFFGIGVAENMLDTQLLMNGFMRMAVDNGALSGNLLIEIDETNLVPGQDMSVYPGKVFRRQSGQPGTAINGTKFPNVSQELLMMFDKSRQLADEATGIPSYTHGSGAVGGVGRTASGMSMLMGAAAQNIKAVVRNIDDYLLAPLGKSLFSFNMQFNFDKEFIGDLDVKARGTESLMRNEVRSQRLLQFMQMTANPSMQPFVKYDYILRELASSMDLDEDKILNDPRQAAIQQKMMSEIQALMPQPPVPPQGAEPQGGPPSPNDPTGNGGGNIAPGQAPEPDAAGFTGGGGGANGGNAPQPQQPPQGMPQ